MCSYQLPVFENYEPGREGDQDREAVSDKIETVQDQLSEYVPPCNFNGFEVDYQMKNDGTNDYEVWIEFLDVDQLFIDNLGSPELYNRQFDHFDQWAKENGYEFHDANIVSTDTSVSYSVTVSIGQNSKFNEKKDNILINMFVASLPDDFPELVKQYANEKNIGLDEAYYKFIGAFENKFEKDNAIEFDLDADELDDLETFMYGRFGDRHIEF